MTKSKQDYWERHGDQPIKFRVWDKLNKTFVNNGWLVCHNDGSMELALPADCHCYVVQQCTWCKDRNGKLIYEGDILETDEAGWIGVVVFGNGRFSIEDSKGGFSAMPNWNGCKIIGNVYQNPELIA